MATIPDTLRAGAQEMNQWPRRANTAHFPDVMELVPVKRFPTMETAIASPLVATTTYRIITMPMTDNPFTTAAIRLGTTTMTTDSPAMASAAARRGITIVTADNPVWRGSTIMRAESLAMLAVAILSSTTTSMVTMIIPMTEGTMAMAIGHTTPMTMPTSASTHPFLRTEIAVASDSAIVPKELQHHLG
ncbi:uncharacterized protein E0L32_002487 [Thyridium curvatum]|uniref:Uncharacterized protein n=1 Tax=Thyridium curvatum TaxID=1093900 RepID=A0A507BPE7_9PEZI|nr:uncharacterized protein E0L32_002487 [Thyridium curvatum]TPX18630.1 hypothetical protein E0L32_002487 [Thyridium curvatum]